MRKCYVRHVSSSTRTAGRPPMPRLTHSQTCPVMRRGCDWSFKLHAAHLRSPSWRTNVSRVQKRRHCRCVQAGTLPSIWCWCRAVLPVGTSTDRGLDARDDDDVLKKHNVCSFIPYGVGYHLRTIFYTQRLWFANWSYISHVHVFYTIMLHYSRFNLSRLKVLLSRL